MKMVIYYSGSCGAIKGGSLPGEPETILHNDANIMLSHWLILNKMQDQHKRFPNILRARKSRKDKRHES